MKNFKKILTITSASFLLMACGGEAKLASPSNLTFDVDAGSFKFDVVEHGEYYQATIIREINKPTYDALKANQRTKDQATSYKYEGEDRYYWNENITSATRLNDKRDKGYIESKFSLRTYSNTAQTPGDPINFSELAPGEYLLLIVANEVEGYTNSDPTLYRFEKSGTLAAPSFTFSVNESGNLEIAADSNYFYKNLTSTGLPSKLKFEIYDGSSLSETVELEDFSWVNTIQGPTNAFTFNNNTITSKKTYSKEKAEDLTVKVTAIGNGSGIKDSSNNAAFKYTFDIPDFAFDASKNGDSYKGPDSFQIEAKVNSLSRPLTCTISSKEGSDFYYEVSDEKNKITGSLNLALTTSQGWGGQVTENKATLTLNGTALSGTYEIKENSDGNYTVNVKNVKQSMGGFPGGPM